MSNPATAEKLTVAPRHRRWGDLAMGIILGLVLGLVIVTAFVFLGSERSVDAPRISRVSASMHVTREGAAAGPQEPR